VETGDTRFDQVIYRIQHLNEIQNLKNDKLTLCAGSTWPEDESVLIPSVSKFILNGQLRLIIAPHEPTDTHIRAINLHFSKLGIQCMKYSEFAGEWKSPVIIIDQIGVLAQLYTQCDFAFVGGAFKAKVHSVMEPLATGRHVLIGPHFNNSPEAIEFASDSNFTIPPVLVCKNKKELEESIDQLMNNSASLESLGVAIKDAVTAKTGATDKAYSYIKNWIH
jgi:3-deoxy-D-manno-octulosonic-acid transferase